jgi:hypothetical protein
MRGIVNDVEAMRASVDRLLPKGKVIMIYEAE